MKFEISPSFARNMDQRDPLRRFRNEFHFPKLKGKTALYFTGNSLGLAPRKASRYIREELDDWAYWGVEGHLHSRRPWLYYHKFFKKSLARLTGSKPLEVVAMHQLTVNLHLMLTTFYRPDGKRNKIIAEAGAFSSDQYAFESQIKLHGLDPAKVLIELHPEKGAHTLKTEKIVEVIHAHADELALVILGGVQYYTGQFFDITTITRAAHQVGAFAGFDLAHAVGNVPLSLHKDDVDFAVWCSYKYLNSGPGGVAGAFVHERHAFQRDLPRMAGWWGHAEKERFQMRKGFIPMPGVDGWQLSNFPVFSGAAHLASLEIFNQTSMAALRKKSVALTGYLEFLLRSIASAHFEIITPSDPAQRGCQLSLLMKSNGRRIFDRITREGVIADWRAPDVIRVAPVPLYNSFNDVFQFYQIFKEALR